MEVGSQHYGSRTTLRFSVPKRFGYGRVLLWAPSSTKGIQDLSGPMRDTPPHIAQYLFEIVSQRRYRTICIVFMWYRASIAEIPLLRGYRTSTSHALQSGKRSEKGEGVSHPIGHVETPKTPWRAIRGYR